MNYPIYTEKADCQDCYKCVRHCPVKAIKVESSCATVDHSLCIFCGKCVSVCPVGAKRIRNDIPRVQHLLKQDLPVYLTLAPSFPAEFNDSDEFERLEAMFLKLGFAGVEGTARGANLLSDLIAEDQEQWFGKISSACPVIVEFIEKYHPRLSSHICDYLSPMLLHGEDIKRRQGACRVVFIGPCIAKKREADNPGSPISIALTFGELRKWIEEEGLDWKSLDPVGSSLSEKSGAADPFPMEGGLGKKIAPSIDSTVIGCSGMDVIKDALDYDQLDNPDAPFLDLLACPGGCLNGPGMGTSGGLLKKQERLLRLSQSTKTDSPVPAKFQLGARGSTLMPIEKVLRSNYGDDEIKRVLKGLGKRSSDDELNCGGCGYNSCRDFASACIDEMAEPVMCVTSMRQLAQKKADALLHTIPMGIVLVDSSLKIRECNARFVRLFSEIDFEPDQQMLMGFTGKSIEKLVPWGDYFRLAMESPRRLDERQLSYQDRIYGATFFAIEEEHLAGAVFQDITSPAMKRETVVKKAEEVIMKSLTSVQQIASLLGENAAETEIILTSLIEAFEPTAEEEK